MGRVVAVHRYLAPTRPDTEWKRILQPEYDALRAASIEVVLNWEWYTTRPLEGYAAGQEDGADALAQANALGHSPLKPVYFSVDTAATFDQVRAYFQGVQAAMGGRPVGVYGGTLVTKPLVASNLCQYSWISNAATWSGAGTWGAIDRTGAHVIQHLDHPIAIPGGTANDYDVNEILSPSFNGADVLTPQDVKAIGDYLERGDGPLAHVTNALLNPANAPHSLLQDVRALEDVILQAIRQQQPSNGQVDPVALSQAIAAHIQLKAV